MKVTVTVGVGSWKASKTLNLVACPHVGDHVMVPGGPTILCEHVYIGTNEVFVDCPIRFASQKDAEAYLNAEEDS